MISFLQGTILGKSPSALVVLTSGGVGYHVRMSPLALTQYTVDTSVSLFTYVKVSENAMELYGFHTAAERGFFELLLTVKGVGPKSALNILSLGSIDHIQAAISRGDATYLSAVQGMGKKTAERLCVELKGKMGVVAGAGEHMSSEDAIVHGEVIDGLLALGYTKEEAKMRMEHVSAEGKTTEQLLKEVLTI